MQKVTKYTIFKTKWGYFGLLGTQNALCRTRLPGPRPNQVEYQLRKNIAAAQRDQTFFRRVQEQIAAYFEGVHVDFDPDIPLALDGLTPFTSSVLGACRRIEFGQVLTYSELAARLGRPAAARAVGNALANNPLPLIIPCHRVIRSDGKIGGFSAPGGTALKETMLLHEQQHRQ
jgi:methylated-DNA-[protein]-cysteine S-methyltransferase